MEEIDLRNDAPLVIALFNQITSEPGDPADLARAWQKIPETAVWQRTLVETDDHRAAGYAYAIMKMENGSYYTEYTGVAREYRGRGIALALKLASIRKAIGDGAPYMRTNNDSSNAPMLAVNRKLGYTPCPGAYDMELMI